MGHGSIGDHSCHGVKSENLGSKSLMTERRDSHSRNEQTGIDSVCHKRLYQIIRPLKPSAALP